jgi:hypothetical protein
MAKQDRTYYFDEAGDQLVRLVFLVHPKQALLGRLQLQPNHPVTKSWVVMTARLPYEKCFEGPKRAWQEKAKQDFVRGFIEEWSAAERMNEPYEPSIPSDFLTELRASESSNLTFDQWWTLEGQINHVEIDEDWRSR